MVDAEEYVERVLSLVEEVPPGRVTTYGILAEAVGQGGPRQVGRVLSQSGGVPFWRVVRADGSLPPCHDARAEEAYAAEQTPRRPSGAIDIRRALWVPPALQR